MPEYIERDALLGEIQTMRNQHLLSKCDGAKIERMARKLPAAEVAPVVHGRWVKVPVPLRKGKYALECSHCKQRLKPLNGELIYCPVCGAKMDFE